MICQSSHYVSLGKLITKLFNTALLCFSDEKFEQSLIFPDAVCANESDTFFLDLIHDFGLRMKSTAVVTKIRLGQYGPFDTRHALLLKDINLENVLNNMKLCNPGLKYLKIDDCPYAKQIDGNVLPCELDESERIVIEKRESRDLMHRHSEDDDDIEEAYT